MILELVSGLVWGMAVPGILGNAAHDVSCKVFAKLRDRTFKPTPDNHDLQKSLLAALRDGIETTTHKQLKSLSLSREERRQIGTWLKQQIKTLNQLIQEVEQGQWYWDSKQDWSKLLRATPQDLADLSQREVNSQLRQMKAELEKALQLADLPQAFREEFEAEWLAWVNLYLAEAIKQPDSRVADILQVELLLDVQTAVEQLAETFNNPQQFLGAVQLVDFDIRALRTELGTFAAQLTGQLDELQGQVGSGFDEMHQRFDRVMLALAQMQGKVVQTVSVNLITVPPNLENWQGREDEIAQLQAWLADSAVDTIGIQGLGGIGKSALAASLYHAAEGFAAKFWADVSQQPDFTIFAEQAITALGDRIRFDVSQLDATQLANILLNCLNQRRCLLVVDNLETLLDDARQWRDPAYEHFFSRWTEQGRTSVVLLTTQEKPVLFQPEPFWLMLQGMQASDGGLLLQSLGIQGELPELQTFAEAVDGHPLTLRLMAGFLKEYCHSQLSQAEALGLATVDQLADAAAGSHRNRRDIRRAWVLQQHFERLSPDLQQFWLRLSVYRHPFDRQAATFMWADGETLADPLPVQQALQDLLNCSLLLELENHCYQFQPFVQAYAQQQAADWDEANARALRYWQSLAAEREYWQTLENATPFLQVFHHYCQQSKYERAFDALDSCDRFLSNQGYNQLRKELYEALVAGFEQLPDLANDAAKKLSQSYGALASALSSLSQFEAARAQSRKQLALSETLQDDAEKAKALLGLAGVHVALGQYSQAIELNEQSLKLLQASQNRSLESYCLRSLGSCFQALSQYHQAIDYCNQSLVIAEELNDLVEVAATLNSLGLIYNNLGQYQQAIQMFEQSLEMARIAGHRSLQVRNLGSLSESYHALGEYQQSIELLEQSLEANQATGDRWTEAGMLRGLGNNYYFLGERTRALEAYEQSLAICCEIGDVWGESGSQLGLGNCYLIIGQYPQSIDCYQKCWVTAQTIGDRTSEAKALIGLSCGYASLSQFHSAIESSQKALAIYQETDDRLGVSTAFANLGRSYVHLGQYQDAIEQFEQQFAIAQDIGVRVSEASALCSLSGIYCQLRQYPRAIECGEKAAAIACEIGNRENEAIAYGNLSNCYRSLGQYDKARELAEAWLTISRKMGDRNNEARALGVIGDSYDALGFPQQKIIHYEQGLSIAQEIGDRQLEVASLYSLGSGYHSLSDYARAIEFLERGLLISQQISTRLYESALLGSLGSSYYALSRYQQAIEYFEQQLVVAQEIEAFRQVASALYMLGQTYHQLGRRAAAIQYYRQACERYEALGDSQWANYCRYCLQQLGVG